MSGRRTGVFVFCEGIRKRELDRSTLGSVFHRGLHSEQDAPCPFFCLFLFANFIFMFFTFLGFDFTCHRLRPRPVPCGWKTANENVFLFIFLFIHLSIERVIKAAVVHSVILLSPCSPFLVISRRLKISLASSRLRLAEGGKNTGCMSGNHVW